MTPRTSIARLADDAPVPRPESWVARKVPGTKWVEIRKPYIDESPAMLCAHAALEAEASATARAVIKMRARAYALLPRDLDTIAEGLFNLSPRDLVTALRQINAVTFMRSNTRFGSEVLHINLRGAMLYARYLRAKARRKP